MTDPAESVDAFINWWAEVAFKRGFVVGFLCCAILVWMA